MSATSNGNNKRIVVVGGGTAGWLAAWIFRERIARKSLPYEVVMIESSAIPIIGVGEGTTAIFKAFLDHFGLDEADFLRKTRATFKLGIRHSGWTPHGRFYDGPIDDPHLIANVPGKPGSELLNVHAVAEGKRVSNSHHFFHLMRNNKVPFKDNHDGTVERLSPFETAYHFDNSKVANWLRGQVPEGANLKVVDAVVKQVNTDVNKQSIVSLDLDNGETLQGDFFIDCTGFKRLLIDALGKSNWVSCDDVLPLNRAMPFQLPHQENAPIIPYTHAKAMNAGWLWQIPTQDRLGNGYAYCDSFLSPEQAQAEVEGMLGQKIEPVADIHFKSGRLSDAWSGNCIALGLSASFMEPLEATSIHSTLVCLLTLEHLFIDNLFSGDNIQRDSYNETVRRQFDDFKVFLAVHYMGGRTDTDFWRSIKEKPSDQRALSRIEQWRDHMPCASDFDSFLPQHLPHVECQLYYPVLDGLELLDRNVARKNIQASGLMKEVARSYRNKVEEAKGIASTAMDHAKFLQAIDAGAQIVLPGRR